jgi:dTDP-4-amino-4,6-dideoxygalactose transaminase
MARRQIRFVDLGAKYAHHVAQFHRDLDRVLTSGWFILGGEGERLEERVKRFTGAEHAIGVGNGTDALILSLKAMGIGPGDEVITTPMSYLATTSTIALCGATAVFVDVDDTLNLDPEQIEAAITERTRAVSVVHLAGIPARIEEIVKVAARHGLAVIEDCAQAFGAALDGRAVGTYGRFGAVSFHPLKNLGTLGDGGLVLAQRTEDAQWLGQARNHGHSSRDECDFWSVNSRLDDLHAAFLNTLLEYHPAELRRRRRLAEIYRDALADIVDFPTVLPLAEPSYNWVMILCDRREELMAYLGDRGVDTRVHYPILIPDLKAASAACRTFGSIANARMQAQRILSLPTAEHVSESDAVYVCEQILCVRADQIVLCGARESA